MHNISKGNAPPGEKQKTCSLQLAACSFFIGRLLLNMRDGPRGRAPAIRFAMVNGLVTLNQKFSVSLCVHSALSAVKEKNTMEVALHTGHNRENYAQNPTKEFRTHCIPKARDLQEEKPVMEEMNDE